MEIWWTRIIQGDRSQLWVCGKGLWPSGRSAADSSISNSATIEPDLGGGSYGDAVAITWERLSGASGFANLHDDPHRGIDRINRFWLPPGQSAGNYRLTITRGDGQKAIASMTIPAARPRRSIIQTGGATEGLASSTVVAANGTLDLEGKTIIVPSDISLAAEKAAIVLQSGSRLTNGRIVIEEGNASEITAGVAVRGSGAGIQVDAVQIINRKPGGAGFYGGDLSVTDSTFSDVDFCADMAFHCNLWCESKRNVFYRYRVSSPRKWRAGWAGRMGLGEENLHVHGVFDGIDRGWTGTPWGAPYYRTAFFECDSIGTGYSVGASEGAILWEAVEAAHGLGLVNGTAGVVNMYADTPENVKTRMLRAGMFVVCGDRWARLTQDATITGSLAFLNLDRSLGQYSGLIRVGNAICQNIVDRCRFENGKSGIWLFGESIENDFVQCFYRDLTLGGVVQLVRPMEDRRRYISASETRNIRRFVEAQNAIDFVTRR